MLRKLVFILSILGSFGVMAQDTEPDASSLDSDIEFFISSKDNVGNLTVLYSGLMVSDSKEVECRPKQIDLEPIKRIPGWEIIANLTNLDESPSEEAVTGPIKTVVSGGWLKLGFVIVNASNQLGQSEGYNLVIDHLTISAFGKHDGRVINFVKTIHSPDSNYCGLPFLYIVPPGTTVRHVTSSESDHPLENLTLYLDGFPFVESVDGDQSVAELPKYTVRLDLMGWFISKDGSSAEPFSKRIQLYTQAQRFITTDGLSWIPVQ